MFQPVESSVSFPKAREKKSPSIGKSIRYTRNRWPRGPRGQPSSSMKVRRRPTACRIPATASPGRSKTSSLATKPCRATAASARPAGTRTACPSRSRSVRNSAYTRRRRSRTTASNRSSGSASRASSATSNSGSNSPSGSASGSIWTRRTSPTTRATSRAFGGAFKNAVRPGPAVPGPQDRLVVGPRRHPPSRAGEVGQGVS